VQPRQAGFAGQFKCFILLQFGIVLQRGCNALMQCTKFPLTGPNRIPRMKLLRRTNRAPP
jgi:hypothetical protein